MTDFTSFDGTRLAYTELGQGRPLLLLHGLFSSAHLNWIKFGTAAELVAAGHRLILPDLRGHGQSAAPQDAAYWPEDVLAQDAEALIAHLALKDFDIGGYSLGARTTVRLLARGLKPARAILAGMGMEGITNATGRTSFFLNVLNNTGTFRPGTTEYMADAFLRQNNIDVAAMIHLLNAQTDTPAETLAHLETRTLVICGEADQDNGSAQALAMALPNAAHVAIPGNHMSAVTKPELGAAMAAWLAH